MPAAATASRDALAVTVAGCVVAQHLFRLPIPCLSVDFTTETALIRPPFARSEVLLVPTRAITGIESPALLKVGVPHYFDAAWAARGLVARSLPRDPGWTGVGMAINSRRMRSQDRLHIHIDCLQPAVIAALHRYGPHLPEGWSLFPARLQSGFYFVRVVDEAEFARMNPFLDIRDGVPAARRAMDEVTIVVAGAILPDGRRGFYLLAGEGRGRNPAIGENLLDHACHIVEES